MQVKHHSKGKTAHFMELKMTELIKTLEAIKVESLKVKIKRGYALIEGWTVRNTETGQYYTKDGVFPYLPAGGRSAAKMVAEGGIYATGKFITIDGV